MDTYLIALGANVGDREYYIEQAIDAIRRKCGKVLNVASVLETEPIGAADQPFLNTALLCESSLDPEALLAELATIEKDLGRERKERWGNRTIDCDIILWKTSDGRFPAFSSPTLTIPHPEAHKRLFVLNPAAEIAGKWQHSLLGKYLFELRDAIVGQQK